MNANGPTEGPRGTGTGQDPMARTARPIAPVDGEVFDHDGLIAFWCGRCARWIDAHIDVEAAQGVHRRNSHPG